MAATTSGSVCRRWAHMSAAGQTPGDAELLYLYGGQAQNAIGDTQGTWTNSLLSLNLQHDFNISSAPLTVVSAASWSSPSPPAVALGALFPVNASPSSSATSLTLYGGECSWQPPVTPAAPALSVLTPGTSSVETSSLPSSIIGSAEGAAAFDPSHQQGWWLGGHVDTYTEPNWSNQTPRYNLSSMLTFDFTSSSPRVDNATASPQPWADGTLSYLPPQVTNTSQGILVVLGGFAPGPVNFGDLSSMTTLSVYDVASKSWSSQSTTGPSPSGRISHCAAVGVATNTWQIYIFGGQSPDQSQQYQDMWVLSSPDFKWTQLSSTSTTDTPSPRAGHTCHIDGDQLLILGGYTGASSTSCDPAPVYVYSISNTTWSSNFVPHTTYSTPKVCYNGTSVQGGTGAGGMSGVWGGYGVSSGSSPSGSTNGAGGSTPGSGSSSSGSSSTGTSSGSGSGSSSGSGSGGGGHGQGSGSGGSGDTNGSGQGNGIQSSPSNKDSSRDSKIGPIIGGVVAALIVLGLAAFAAIQHRRRRRRSQNSFVAPVWFSRFERNRGGVGGSGHYRHGSNASSSDAASMMSSIHEDMGEGGNSRLVVAAGWRRRDRPRTITTTHNTSRHDLVNVAPGSGPEDVLLRPPSWHRFDDQEGLLFDQDHEPRPSLSSPFSTPSSDSAAAAAAGAAVTTPTSEYEPLRLYGGQANSSGGATLSHSGPTSITSAPVDLPTVGHLACIDTSVSRLHHDQTSLDSDIGSGGHWLAQGSSSRLVPAPFLTVANPDMTSPTSSLRPQVDSGTPSQLAWTSLHDPNLPFSDSRSDNRILRVANPNLDESNWSLPSASVEPPPSYPYPYPYPYPYDDPYQPRADTLPVMMTTPTPWSLGLPPGGHVVIPSISSRQNSTSTHLTTSHASSPNSSIRRRDDNATVDSRSSGAAATLGH